MCMQQTRRAAKGNVLRGIIVATMMSLEDRIKNCHVYKPAWFVFLVFLNLSVTLHVPLMVVPNLATRCAWHATMSLLILLLLDRTISLLQAGPALLRLVRTRTRARQVAVLVEHLHHHLQRTLITRLLLPHLRHLYIVTVNGLCSRWCWTN